MALVLLHAWPKPKIPLLVLSTETLVTQDMYPVAVYTSVKREKIRSVLRAVLIGKDEGQFPSSVP